MKKGIAIGIISLFLFLAVVPISLGVNVNIPRQTLSRKIITVDEHGYGDYTSIKEAVNNASAGDTIEVFSGTYNEYNIHINHTGITLIGIPHELGNGSDKGKPVINGQGKSTVLNVDVSNVTISGFHIENKGNGGGDIMDIWSSANNCTVLNNTLYYSDSCIIYEQSSYCTISNNTIRWAGMYCGIGLDPDCHNNFISNNTISNCPRGIDCSWGSQDNTKIIGNLVSYCSEYGIYIIGIGSEIRDNKISHCGTGIISGGDKVLHNDITNNSYGIDVYSYGTVTENNIFNNGENAWFYGMLSIWSKNYWGRPYLLPYMINGILFSFGFPDFPFIDFPWIKFDWQPAQKPYTI